MKQIVCLNYEYLDLIEAKISVMDRGFLFADGVYEVVPIYGSRSLFPEEHYARLMQNLEKVSINAQLSYDAFITIINQLIKLNPPQSMQSCYLQITRGVCWERKQFVTGTEPTIFAKLEQVVHVPGPNTHISTITVDDWRWGRCDIKGTNRLANVLMIQKAYAANASEAIIFDNGYALEGASSNLFIVEKNVVITPPLSNKLLDGVTRKMVINLVQEKYTLIEEQISRERLFAADEVWLTSSTKEIAAVIKIDEQLISNGICGPVTLEIQNRYKQYIDDIVQKNLSQTTKASS